MVTLCPMGSLWGYLVRQEVRKVIFGCLIWGSPFWTPKNDVIGPPTGPSRFKNIPSPQGIHRTLRPLSLPRGYGPTYFLSLDQGGLEGDLTARGPKKCLFWRHEIMVNLKNGSNQPYKYETYFSDPKCSIYRALGQKGLILDQSGSMR